MLVKVLKAVAIRHINESRRFNHRRRPVETCLFSLAETVE
jgi:hypothetical protein